MKYFKILIVFVVTLAFLADQSFALTTPYRSRAKQIIESSYSKPVPESTTIQLEKKYFTQKLVKQVSTAQNKGLIGDILYWLATRKDFSASAGSGNNYDVIYSRSAKELRVEYDGPTPHSWCDYKYELDSGIVRKSSPGWNTFWRPGDTGYAEAKQAMRDYCITGIQRCQAGQLYQGSVVDYVKSLVILAD